MFADWFFDIPTIDTVSATLRSFMTIITAFTMVLGAVNLIRLHGGRINTGFRTGNYNIIDIALSGWLIVVLLAFIIIGAWDVRSTQYQWLYDYVQIPCRATMYACILWYLIPGCYRFLRARSVEATFITVAAFIGLMANTPIWNVYAPIMKTLNTWIQSNVTTSAYRGILIGAGFGTLGIGIRTILGIESGYLGRLRAEEATA
jgi:hypothetical protein